MKATITPNTNPIDATILNPVSKSFASGGGTGGGPLTLAFSGVNNGSGLNAATVNVPKSVLTTVLTFPFTYTGNRNIVALLNPAISGFGIAPANTILEGLITITVDYDTNTLTDSYIFDLSGGYLPSTLDVFKLFSAVHFFNTPTAAGAQAPKVQFLHTLEWILIVAPFTRTPVTLAVTGSRLTLMEI